MSRHTRFRTFVQYCWVAAFVVMVGCAHAPGLGTADSGAGGTVGAPRLLKTPSAGDDLEDAQDYDPWQPFNEAMFSFNQKILDRWLMKPVATGWGKVMPAAARRGIARVFTNLEMPRRVVNNLLQARPVGAGREIARFTVNTTIGLAGLIDVATAFHIKPSNADAGETLALYGAGPGPYLVLPTFPPLTVRDAIGRGIDSALDPISYLMPFFANRAKSFVSAVNDRSLNLKLFANVEDSVIDLYSAARNGYLQRRRVVIARIVDERREEWAWAFSPKLLEPTEHPMVALEHPKDPA